jgi:hypothetical protein
MKKGRAGTMTHDYKRHGTTTLFAALNVLDGTVIGQCMQKHRHQEFIRFLKLQMTINEYLDDHNAAPKPFVWTASASSIIEKVNRGKQALESLH